MEKTKCAYVMFALFLLAKQSRDLRVIQAPLKDKRRNVLEEWCCWEEVVELNNSYPTQSTYHHFRHL